MYVCFFLQDALILDCLDLDSTQRREHLSPPDLYRGTSYATLPCRECVKVEFSAQLWIQSIFPSQSEAKRSGTICEKFTLRSRLPGTIYVSLRQWYLLRGDHTHLVVRLGRNDPLRDLSFWSLGSFSCFPEENKCYQKCHI